MRARGALLLESLLALAIFAMAGIAILTLVGQGARSVELTRERLRALDLARSAMARLEAGIDTPETLHGPVAPWGDEAGGAFADAPPRETGWELRIETTRSEFDGLTMVTVTAQRAGAEEGGPGSVTLRQLVRLAEQERDELGEEDELMELIEEEARRMGGGR